MNRRELLRYFTAGAAVVPILQGNPKLDAAATLIEVPKVEPLSAQITPVMSSEGGRLLFTVTNRETQQCCVFEGNACDIKMDFDTKQLRGRYGYPDDILMLQKRLGFTISGRCRMDEQGILARLMERV
jgi:hypothetical protein